MPRLKYSLLAVAGIVLLAVVLSVIGPKRALAALGYTPIRDVDNPARNPFQISTGNVFVLNRNNSGNLDAVPAGSRLVIEQVSVTASVPSGQSGFFSISTTAGGNGESFVIPTTQRFFDGSGTDILVATQSLRLYADPGTTPQVNFFRSSTAGFASFQGMISGYKVGL